jgi:hypothetical protein
MLSERNSDQHCRVAIRTRQVFRECETNITNKKHEILATKKKKNFHSLNLSDDDMSQTCASTIGAIKKIQQQQKVL